MEALQLTKDIAELNCKVKHLGKKRKQLFEKQGALLEKRHELCDLNPEIGKYCSELARKISDVYESDFLNTAGPIDFLDWDWFDDVCNWNPWRGWSNSIVNFCNNCRGFFNRFGDFGRICCSDFKPYKFSKNIENLKKSERPGLVIEGSDGEVKFNEVLQHEEAEQFEKDCRNYSLESAVNSLLSSRKIDNINLDELYRNGCTIAFKSGKDNFYLSFHHGKNCYSSFSSSHKSGNFITD